MLTTTQMRIDPATERSHFPLGRTRCACGGIPDHTGECAACRAKRLARERAGRPMTTSEATAHSFGRMRVDAVRDARPPVPYTLTTDVKTDRHPVRAGFMSEGAPRSAEEGGGITKLAQQDQVVGGVIGGVIGGVLAGPLGAVAGAAIGAAAAAPSCTYAITYANQSNVGCGAQCGAQIRFDITRVTASGSGCPSLKGLRVTESVTTDNGCGPGSVQTGAGCPIGAGGTVSNCTDTYGLCGPATAFPVGGCTEVYTQQLSVGGQHAETRTITFRISRTSSACSGTVTRT